MTKKTQDKERNYQDSLAAAALELGRYIDLAFELGRDFECFEMYRRYEGCGEQVRAICNQVDKLYGNLEKDIKGTPHEEQLSPEKIRLIYGLLNYREQLEKIREFGRSINPYREGRQSFPFEAVKLCHQDLPYRGTKTTESADPNLSPEKKLEKFLKRHNLLPKNKSKK